MCRQRIKQPPHRHKTVFRPYEIYGGSTCQNYYEDSATGYQLSPIGPATTWPLFSLGSQSIQAIPELQLATEPDLTARGPPSPVLSVPVSTGARATPCVSPETINKIGVLNIEGLKTQSSSSVHFVQDLLEEHNMLFIALTETWLRDHLDAEISIPNYTIFRTDRSRPRKGRGRNSGGVAFYIRNDIAASTEPLLHHSDGSTEVLGVNIKSHNTILFLLYRPPSYQAGENASEGYQHSLSKITNIIDSLQSPMPNIVILGDFNLPKASWPHCIPKQGASQSDKNAIEQTAELISQYFLEQLVNEPTHKGGNILDILLTNNSSLFLNHSIIPTAPVSSHHLVQFTTLLACAPEAIKKSDEPQSAFDSVNLRGYDTNWQEIKCSLISLDWNQLFINLSPTSMLQIFIKKCEEIVLRFAPKKRKFSKKANYKKIPRHRKALMRSRTKTRKRYNEASIEARKEALGRKLIQIESQLQDSYRSQLMYDENKAVESIKSNPKYFFSYSRDRLRTKHQIGPLCDDSGNITSDPAAMACLLSDQYKRAFSLPTNRKMGSANTLGPLLSDIQFSEENIREAINEVRVNSAPGPDRFPALLLRTCKDELAYPLYLIWRSSLDTGDIPQIAKTSVITPVFKNGDKQKPKNYRPVALTSHLIKVFEKVIRKQLTNYIEENNMFNPNQHGFRAGHSCLSQLVQHYDKITRYMEEGNNVDIIYLDFSKAFDKLDFSITLQKIKNLGITGRILDWIRSFLTGRKQVVHVDGAKSSYEDVLSGVPQGSVLGPLLFLVMLGDIDSGIVSSSVSSFADDTRVVARVRGLQDTLDLQNDLQTIYQWSSTNNAQFNAEKFECLRYGYNEEIKTTTSYLSNTGSQIKNSDVVKDLGVTMSCSANFSDHINNITLSANLMCGWIVRTFRTRSQTLMLTLWKSLVLPILDYCCQLWTPSRPGEIQKLEAVQESMVKKITGMADLNYWEQLSALNLYSLQRRRERYVAIYIWKILENLTPNFGINVVSNARKGRYCQVPHVKTTAPGRVQNLRFSSLTINGPRVFNSLPVNLRNMTQCTVECFKKSLDNHLQTIPDEPRVKKLIPYCSQPSNSLIHMNPK